MEEDIKILEEMRKKMNKTLSHKITKQEFQAIKNLIKGYRELEEQIDKHVYFETTNPKEIEKNFIPKSKIKEKIEEIIKSNPKQSEDYEVTPEESFAIEILEELMEDK